MIKLKLAKYVYFFLNVFILFLPLSNYAQNDKTFSVKWVNEFRSTKDWDENSGIAKKLFILIMGDDYVELNRPVNVLVNANKYWILDQGSLSINFVDFENRESERLNDKNDKSFPSLVGICSGENDKIYFTDSQKNKIYKYDSENKISIEFAKKIKLNKPTGIAYSNINKSLYVCETGNHRILEIDLKGNLKHVIGPRGNHEGEFNFPTYIWIDNSGFIYIVDSMNFRVQIFNNNNKLISTFGEAGDGTGYLARPKGIATDSYGHVYIVDALFHNVQVFNLRGEFLYHFGGQGRGEGEFWLPMGIYIDELNKIYVADSYNSRIQIFQLVEGKHIEN